MRTLLRVGKEAKGFHVGHVYNWRKREREGDQCPPPHIERRKRKFSDVYAPFG